MGGWRAAFRRDRDVDLELRLFQQEYWESMRAMLSCFAPVAPSVRLRARRALDDAQRRFLEKNLLPLAPGGLEIATVAAAS